VEQRTQRSPAACDPPRSRLWPWLVASALLHAVLTLLGRDATLAATAPVAPPPPTVLRLEIAKPAPVAAPPVSAPPPKPPAREPAPRPTPQVRTPTPSPAAPTPREPSAAAPAEPSPSEAVEVAAVDVAALERAREADRLAVYMAEVRSRVAAHKRYPSMARSRGIEGLVIVRVAIGADGSLESVEVAGEGSGVLARATRQAVERAAPFPVPPRSDLSFEIPIRYDLDD